LQGHSIPWAQLQAGINNASSVRDKIAQGAANFACGLYRNYPEWAKGTGPAKNVLDGLWNDLCSPRPPGLPSGAKPHGGGMCDGVVYGFRYKCYPFGGGSPVIIGAGFGGDPFTYWGPIGGVSIRNNADRTQGEIWLEHRGDDNNTILPFANYFTYPTSPFEKVELIELRRMDGQPDTCGNYPGGYPGGSGSPSLSELSTNLPISLPSGIDIDLPIGLVAVDIDAGITLSVGSIPVTIDFGGLTFAPEFNIGGGDGGNGGEGDGKYIPSHISPNASNYDEGDGGEGESGGEDGIPNIKWVTVSLTTIPSNAKKQFGMGAPDIIYAGWFEWRASGKCLPREPIQFAENIYQAPDGVDGYAYTMQSGYKAQAIVYTEKAEGG
jgi:hypothetical protein